MRTKNWWMGGLALVLLGCGGAKTEEAVSPDKETACPDGTVNGGKTILTMDCNTVVQYQGNEFESSLEVKDWVKAGLHNAPKVLRDVDHAATESQVQFTQTCRLYNSCQMKSEEFNAELARTQDQFRRLREKIALLEASNGNPEVLRTTLSEVVVATVPPQKRAESTLAVNLLVQVKDPANSAPRSLSEGETLHTGAKLVVGLEVSQPAYAYVFEKHESKALDVLFPNAKIQTLSNPIASGAMVRVPPGGQVFTLNNQDLGTETLYVAVSLRPLADLESALNQTASAPAAGGDRVGSALGRLFEEGKPECNGQHRGLEVTDDPCGDLTRGFTTSAEKADDFFGGTGSTRAQATPGDDVVIKTFSFKHVP